MHRSSSNSNGYCTELFNSSNSAVIGCVGRALTLAALGASLFAEVGLPPLELGVSARTPKEEEGGAIKCYYNPLPPGGEITLKMRQETFLNHHSKCPYSTIKTKLFIFLWRVSLCWVQKKVALLISVWRDVTYFFPFSFRRTTPPCGIFGG